LELGSWDEALSHFQRALELDPGRAETWLNIGNVQLAQGRFSEAVTQYRRGLAINPNYADAQSNLGRALLAQGKFDEAAPAFERAIALKPDFVDAYNNLARAFFNVGRGDEALGALRRAIDIGGTGETKSLFVQFLRAQPSIPSVDDLRELMVRALTEPWHRPREIAPIATGLIRYDIAIQPCIERA